jgi:molybdopterin biosynthesis enzyme
MRKKAKKRVSKRARGQSAKGKRSPKAGAATKTRPVAATPAPANAAVASERFVNDLLVRGEAAPLDESGKLPLDATHVIKKQNGKTEVQRVRYKTF